MESPVSVLRRVPATRRFVFFCPKTAVGTIAAVWAFVAVMSGALWWLSMTFSVLSIGHPYFRGVEWLWVRIVLWCCGLTLSGAYLSLACTRKADSLSYATSDREQIAELRENDLLLRGAGEPDEIIQALLRPANPAALFPSEQLLRAEPPRSAKVS